MNHPHEVEKKKIKVGKNFFKGMKWKIKLVDHSTEPLCYCVRCIEMRNENRIFLQSLIKSK